MKKLFTFCLYCVATIVIHLHVTEIRKQINNHVLVLAKHIEIYTSSIDSNVFYEKENGLMKKEEKHISSIDEFNYFSVLANKAFSKKQL
ncbi:MAG: hypothetical protein JXR07_14380 [Reichenbachiella sp.]